MDDQTQLKTNKAKQTSLDMHDKSKLDGFHSKRQDEIKTIPKFLRFTSHETTIGKYLLNQKLKRLHSGNQTEPRFWYVFFGTCSGSHLKQIKACSLLFCYVSHGCPRKRFGFSTPFFSMLSYVSETLVMLPRNTIVLVIPSLCAAMLLEPSPGVSLLDLDSRLLSLWPFC